MSALNNSDRILDADREDLWGPVYAPFFADVAEPEQWMELLTSENYNGAQSRETALIKLVPDLRPRAEAFLREHFTHVALYHGCRIADETSYRTHGLLPSNTDQLVVFARQLFGDTAELAAALRDLDGYGVRKYNHGKVFFFFARSGAIHVGEHYRESGSELLRGLASRLGGDALVRLSARGRPALVRCRMPLSLLDASDVSFAAMLPIRHRLMVRDPEMPPRIYALEGGFPYPRAVPAELLEIEYTEEP